ncbi:MAG: hypothetical protein LBO81_07240, partial [Clostridiales Family XIII bacterium]|nr:hypothetical protein [Clostridiales Family XIII bacterium]
MKRTVISIIIVLITLAVSAVALWPFFPPSAEKAGFNFATDERGSLYLSESHADCSFLYRVDDQNRIDYVLKTPGIITRIVTMGERIYFLTVKEDPAEGWSLMETDRQLDGAHEVASGKFDLLGDAYTLSSGTDKVFLSGAGPAGQKLLVLSYAPNGSAAQTKDPTGALTGVTNMSVHMQYVLTGSDAATDYVCDGRSIIVLLTGGQIARITPDGVARTEELYRDSLLRCEGGRLTVLNKYEGKIFVESEFPQFTATHTYENLDVRGFAVRGDGAVVLGSEENKDTALYFADAASGTEWTKGSEMRISFSEHFDFMDYKSPKIWIITLVLAAAFIFAALLSVHMLRLVFRVCATFAAMGCFMLSVMCYLVFAAAGKIALVEVDAISGGVVDEYLASDKIQANLFSFPSSGGVVHEYLASEGMQADVTFSAFCYGGLALICAIMIAVVFMVFSLRPMRDLTKRIGRFVEGDFTVDGMVAAKGDLGRL